MTNIVSSQSSPVLLVYVASTISGVTGNGTVYTVLYDTVAFGDSANYSSGLYTVPITNNYLISACFTFSNIINAANSNLSGPILNGTTYAAIENSMNALKDSLNTFSFNFTTTSFMTSGQTIGTVAKINNGSTASVNLSGGTSPYLNWMFIRYLF